MSVSEYVFCMPSANVMESVDVVLSSSSVAVSLCAFFDDGDIELFHELFLSGLTSE